MNDEEWKLNNLHLIFSLSWCVLSS